VRVLITPWFLSVLWSKYLTFIDSRRTVMIIRTPGFNLGIGFYGREYTGVRPVVDRVFLFSPKINKRYGFYFTM
jgi:hypothetical protein